jgi:hypothetical protein
MFVTAGFLDLTVAALGDAVGIGAGFFWPGRLTGGCHFWLFRCLRDLLRVRVEEGVVVLITRPLG